MGEWVLPRGYSDRLFPQSSGADGETEAPEPLETKLVGRGFHETVSGSLFLKGGTDGLGSQTATVIIQSSHLGIDDTDIHGRRGTRPPP